MMLKTLQGGLLKTSKRKAVKTLLRAACMLAMGAAPAFNTPKGADPAGEVALICPSTLASAIASDDPPLVLEATVGCAASGASCFVPGAVLFDLAAVDVYEEDATGSPLPLPGNYNLRPPAALRAALERHGVRARRRCVVYTQCRRHTTAAREAQERGHHHRYRPAASREGVADPIVAARLVWCLAYAGVERVALLDGGMSLWLDGGFPVAGEPSPAAPVGGCLDAGPSVSRSTDTSAKRPVGRRLLRRARWRLPAPPGVPRQC